MYRAQRSRNKVGIYDTRAEKNIVPQGENVLTKLDEHLKRNDK